MQYLEYTEFYITNVCNLNCPNCNRFNNYPFKGHFLWDDHKEDYKEWSKKLQFKLIGILGGEPLLNPNLLDWIHGVAELWPESKIVIVTNGTQLDKWPNLHKELRKYKGRVYLEISNHNPFKFQNLLDLVKSFYPTTPEIFYKKEDWIPHFDKLSATQQLKFVDENNIEVQLLPGWSFKNSALIYSKDNLKLHNSNKELAFRICDFKFCHHFLDGKLYKCGVTAVLPKFMKQFKVEMTDHQKELIESYKPAEHTWDDDQLSQFIDNLKSKKSIAQCSLCPEKEDYKPFAAGNKKLKIIPIENSSY
jgi:organic radical activating enzyme